MNTLRAITSGALVWIMIFISYTIMSFIPGLKDSEFQQYLVIYTFLIPFVLLGLKFYYKKGKTNNVLTLALVMASTAFLLDMVITVPFVIIPHGGSYSSFFGDPMFWVLPVEYIVITTLHWSRKFKTSLA